MSLLTLSITLGFVVIALGLSKWLKLGVEKDLMIATVRSTIQLLIVGYILNTVFSLHGAIFIILMIILMIGAATQNAQKRGKPLKGVAWRVLVAITLTEIITQSLMLIFHIVDASPRYIIPISGMIIGNSMIIAGLFLNRMKAEVNSRRQEILVLLSLGATPKQAIRSVLKEAIRASLIPTIDSTKTMGLVQLPGMMTGQIIAGADPITAVRYQLLIVFTLLAAASLTSITLGFLVAPTLFNEYQQLRELG